MFDQVHGKSVVKIGNRYFAITKDVGKADRIHQANEMGSTWNRQMTLPKARCIRTRSIRNARA